MRENYQTVLKYRQRHFVNTEFFQPDFFRAQSPRRQSYQNDHLNILSVSAQQYQSQNPGVFELLVLQTYCLQQKLNYFSLQWMPLFLNQLMSTSDCSAFQSITFLYFFEWRFRYF